MSAYHSLACRSSSPVRNVDTGYSLNSASARIFGLSDIPAWVILLLCGAGMYGTVTRRTVIWEPGAQCTEHQ